MLTIMQISRRLKRLPGRFRVRLVYTKQGKSEGYWVEKWSKVEAKYERYHWRKVCRIGEAEERFGLKE